MQVLLINYEADSYIITKIFHKVQTLKITFE